VSQGQVTISLILLEIYDGLWYILRPCHYYIPCRIRWLLYCEILKENGSEVTKCHFVCVTAAREILTVDLVRQCLQLYCYTSVGGGIVLRHMLLHSLLYIIHVIITSNVTIPTFPTIMSGWCKSRQIRRKNSMKGWNENVNDFFFTEKSQWSLDVEETANNVTICNCASRLTVIARLFLCKL